VKFEGPKTWTPLENITALATHCLDNMVYCVFGLRIAKLAVSIAGCRFSRVNVCDRRRSTCRRACRRWRGKKQPMSTESARGRKSKGESKHTEHKRSRAAHEVWSPV